MSVCCRQSIRDNRNAIKLPLNFHNDIKASAAAVSWSAEAALFAAALLVDDIFCARNSSSSACHDLHY